jgi:hypothetical protein
LVTAHTPTGEEAPTGFTVEDIQGVLTHPIYAGLGPYPALIDDERYVAAAARLIREQGAEQFLVNPLAVLREAFGALFDRRPECGATPC